MLEGLLCGLGFEGLGYRDYEAREGLPAIVRLEWCWWLQGTGYYCKASKCRASRQRIGDAGAVGARGVGLISDALVRKPVEDRDRAAATDCPVDARLWPRGVLCV